MSVKRDAAIRIFARGGDLNLSAMAREISAEYGRVSRQAIQKWLREYRANPDREIRALEMRATKGADPVAGSASTHGEPGAHATPVPQPATESLQARPHMTMAERRANSRALILESLARGAYRKFAAARGGISLATFYNYMNSDPEFKAAVEAVEADAVHDVVGALYDDAVNGRPGARAVPSAIWLERRHPGLYGRRANVAVDVEVRGTIDIRRVITSDEAIRAISAYEIAT